MNKVAHFKVHFNKLLVTAAIALIVATTIIFTIGFLPNNFESSTPDCDRFTVTTKPQIKSNNRSESLQIHPIKIVAEPWRGGHNVYAIFALPLQFKDTYCRSKLLVKGTDTAWSVTIANERLYGLPAPEGYFLVIGFFRTRIALWYMISGRFDDLKQPVNWTLYL